MGLSELLTFVSGLLLKLIEWPCYKPLSLPCSMLCLRLNEKSVWAFASLKYNTKTMISRKRDCYIIYNGLKKVYRRATLLADRGPNPDLWSIDTGSQAPEWVIVGAATDCEKAQAHFTKLCGFVLSSKLFSNKVAKIFAHFSID